MSQAAADHLKKERQYQIKEVNEKIDIAVKFLDSIQDI